VTKEKTMSTAHRIDVHQHVVPPFYAEALAAHGGDPSGSVTALSSGPAVPTLKAFAPSGHILFGTDSPYDHGVSAAFTAALDADDSLTPDDQAAISHRNAQALFPRLAQHDRPAAEHRGG
jgi:predicted TIM-barrel fold metal-dependent hydrolase